MSPDTLAIIQRTLDTIEERLRGEITPEELSAEAGFSVYHFHRLFEAATGLSIMRYVTMRRLLHAACEISAGRDVLSAALDYGFDTHAGFYKAFRKAFGASPAHYLRDHTIVRPSRVCMKESGKMIDQKTLATALTAWNIDVSAAARTTYANTGRLSEHTFRIGDHAYLRCTDALGEAQRQLPLMKALHAAGLSAAVIPTPDGREIVRAGDFDCLLTEAIPGRPVDAADMLAHPERAEAIGEGLAHLHAALRDCDPLLCSHEDLLATVQHWALPKAREAMLLPAAWADAWLARFAAGYPQLPTQLIHRDPNPDNLLVRPDGSIAFLDFNLSRIMPGVFDLAYAATGILSSVFPDATPDALSGFVPMAHAIWRGYHRVRPLTPAEQQLLPDMVIAVQLICVAAFHGSTTNAHLSRINQGMLRMILREENSLRSFTP